MKLTELKGEAYIEGLNQTARLWNSTHGIKYKPKDSWYELEDWADAADLDYDEDGNIL